VPSGTPLKTAQGPDEQLPVGTGQPLPLPVPLPAGVAAVIDTPPPLRAYSAWPLIWWQESMVWTEIVAPPPEAAPTLPHWPTSASAKEPAISATTAAAVLSLGCVLI